VTVACSDVEVSARTYRDFLGYEISAQYTVDGPLARFWERPGLVGRRVTMLLPAGSGTTYIRLVETPRDPAYRPFLQMGWNAAELIVQDVDAIAGRLTGSPFRIIGPPADLSFTNQIRAMQVVGPDNEALYLTSCKGHVAGFDMPVAQHFVDRVFIVILGGPSVQELIDFYAREFGVARPPVMPVVISVLSAAHGMPLTTRHDLAALALREQCYIEADAMPQPTRPRGGAEGELPPAIGIVSFAVDALPLQLAQAGAGPAALPNPPYSGRPALLCRGPAGEIIEFIER
jgi:hypothetical protein